MPLELLQGGRPELRLRNGSRIVFRPVVDCGRFVSLDAGLAMDDFDLVDLDDPDADDDAHG
jgi:hypothetical protein